MKCHVVVLVVVVLTVPCYKWPKDPKQSISWRSFLISTRSDSFSVSQVASICCLHFEEKCFENFREWEEGFSVSLQPRPGSVPTVRTCRANPIKDKVKAVVIRGGRGQ